MSHHLNRPAARIADAQSPRPHDVPQGRKGPGARARMTFFLEPRSADEFVLVAKWHRSVEALVFYVDALIGWAPIEVTDMPVEFTDEHAAKWQLCRFRYSGPLKDRDRLIDNAKCLLSQLTDWIEPEILLSCTAPDASGQAARPDYEPGRSQPIGPELPPPPCLQDF